MTETAVRLNDYVIDFALQNGTAVFGESNGESMANMFITKLSNASRTKTLKSQTKADSSYSQCSA